MLRLLIIVPALVIAYAMPASAQQSARQTVEAFVAKYNDTIVRKDAAGLAAMFTQDGIQVTPQGPVMGREALQKHLTQAVKPVIDHAAKVDQVSMLNDTSLWATGSYSATIDSPNGPVKIGGYWGATYIRDGSDLKCSMLTYNLTPAPTPEAKK